MELTKKIAKRNLIRSLEVFSIDPLVTHVKKYSDAKSDYYHPLATKEILKGNEGHFNNCNSVTAVILNRKIYVIPTGIIKEYDFIVNGLTLKDFPVPLSDCIYNFKNKDMQKKWDFLISLQNRLQELW